MVADEIISRADSLKVASDKAPTLTLTLTLTLTPTLTPTLTLTLTLTRCFPPLRGPNGVKRFKATNPHPHPNPNPNPNPTPTPTLTLVLALALALPLLAVQGGHRELRLRPRS